MKENRARRVIEADYARWMEMTDAEREEAYRGMLGDDQRWTSEYHIWITNAPQEGVLPDASVSIAAPATLNTRTAEEMAPLFKRRLLGIYARGLLRGDWTARGTGRFAFTWAHDAAQVRRVATEQWPSAEVAYAERVWGIEDEGLGVEGWVGLVMGPLQEASMAFPLFVPQVMPESQTQGYYGGVTVIDLRLAMQLANVQTPGDA